MWCDVAVVAANVSVVCFDAGRWCRLFCFKSPDFDWNERHQTHDAVKRSPDERKTRQRVPVLFRRRCQKPGTIKRRHSSTANEKTVVNFLHNDIRTLDRSVLRDGRIGISIDTHALPKVPATFSAVHHHRIPPSSRLNKPCSAVQWCAGRSLPRTHTGRLHPGRLCNVNQRCHNSTHVEQRAECQCPGRLGPC